MTEPAFTFPCSCLFCCGTVLRATHAATAAQTGSRTQAAEPRSAAGTGPKRLLVRLAGYFAVVVLPVLPLQKETTNSDLHVTTVLGMSQEVFVGE